MIAKALRVEHDPRGLKLREVARQASISAPSVFNHFANLEDLLATIMCEHLSGLPEIHAAVASLAPRDAIRAMNVRHAQLLAKNPAAAYLMTADLQLRAELAPIRQWSKNQRICLRRQHPI